MVKMELFQGLYQELATFLMWELLFFITVHSERVVIAQLQLSHITIEQTIAHF